MKTSEERPFTSQEQQTWKMIISEHEKKRDQQLHPLFLRGVKELGITSHMIPDLKKINQTLRKLTNFIGVYVEGLEDGPSFYSMLKERKFPIGNFIRDQKDLNYTPAPDIVHDLYGHMPFFIDSEYADFCQRYGEVAMKYADHPELFRQFERFFWFTIEFGLVKTSQGVRIFGGGIASSIGECVYALSGDPKVIPFDIDIIRKQEFRIDEMQKILFLLESPEQLYSSLPNLEKAIRLSP